MAQEIPTYELVNVHRKARFHQVLAKLVDDLVPRVALAYLEGVLPLRWGDAAPRAPADVDAQHLLMSTVG
jgi:hypothetical protein